MGKRIGEKLSTVDHDDLTSEEWIKLYGSTASYPNKVLFKGYDDSDVGDDL